MQFTNPYSRFSCLVCEEIFETQQYLDSHFTYFHANSFSQSRGQNFISNHSYPNFFDPAFRNPSPNVFQNQVMQFQNSFAIAGAGRPTYQLVPMTNTNNINFHDHPMQPQLELQLSRHQLQPQYQFQPQSQTLEARIAQVVEIQTLPLIDKFEREWSAFPKDNIENMIDLELKL